MCMTIRIYRFNVFYNWLRIGAFCDTEAFSLSTTATILWILSFWHVYMHQMLRTQLCASHHVPCNSLGAHQCGNLSNNVVSCPPPCG